MPGEYLPPVIAEFQADIAAFLAKLEEAKLALRSFRDEAGRGVLTRVNVDSRPARSEMTNLERDVSARAGRMGRTIGSETSRGFRDSMRQSDKDAKIAADLLSDSFITRFRANMARAASGGGNNQGGMMAALLPGGQRGGAAGIAGAVGLGALAGAPLAAGLAFPIVGGLVTAASAAGGAIPMFAMLRSAMGDVTKAAATLQTQQDKYNAAADITATYLQTDSAALKNYNTLLSQLTPVQSSSLQLLTQQDVQWGNLNFTQQAGLIQLRDTTAIYKALAPSQQNSLNALIAEKNALYNLEPAQQAAVTGYVNMTTQWNNLKSAAMPSMFDLIASAEKVATDAMKPLLPLVQASAGAFKTLFDRIDAAVQGPGYASFIAMLTKQAPLAIIGWGTALGNVAVGVEHIWLALQPMAPVFLDWLDRTTKGFAGWATTPKGMQDLQHFMDDLTKNAPGTFEILGNLTRSIGALLAMFAGDRAILALLNVFSSWLLTIIHNPIGGKVVEFLAFAEAMRRIALATGAAAIAQAALKAAGFGTAAAAGAGAAGGAAAAAGAAGSTASVGGTLGLIGLRSSLAGIAGLAVPIAGAVTALGLIATGLTIWQQHTKDAANNAAGVITHSDGTISAALKVGNTTLSPAFRDLANSIQQGAIASDTTTRRFIGTNAQTHQAMYAYTTDFTNSNNALKTIINMGKDQFGQSAALFSKDVGGDTLFMAQALQQGGRTFTQAFTLAATTAFDSMAKLANPLWDKLASNYQQQGTLAAQQMITTTKNDSVAVTNAAKGFIDDAMHQRVAKEQQDIKQLSGTVQQYIDDYHKGLIVRNRADIDKMSQDVQKANYDASRNDSAAFARDIQQLSKDTQGNFDTGTIAMEQAARAAMGNATASFDTMMAALAQNTVVAGRGALPGGNPAVPVHKAAGGPVWGSPGVDKVPAMLTHGEFVVNAKSTSQHYQLLHAINSQHLASGGIAGVMGDSMATTGMWAGADYLQHVKLLTDQYNAAKAAQAAAAAAAATNNAGGFGGAASGAAQQYAASQLSHYGWGANQMGPLIALWNQESGWNPNAVNPSSGAYGIPQALGHGHPFNLGDYVAQINWGLQYIAGRYGSPAAAWAHEQANNWYDDGGQLRPGHGTYSNGTGKPEYVLTHAQWAAVIKLAAGGGGGAAAGGAIENVIKIDGREIYRSVRTVEWRSQRRNGGTTLLIPGLGI